ncbi:MAG: GNAT family N-acetyltransferase, partial [Actinomycetota bacterium]
ADLDLLRGDGAVVVLRPDGRDRPVVHDDRGPVLLASIPEDIVRLRAQDRSLANRWRTALREVFTGAMRDGYAAVGMTRSGWYVLRHDGRN